MARERWGTGPYVVRDVQLATALIVEAEPRCLHVASSPRGEDALQVRMLSGPRPAEAGVEPIEHVQLEIERAPATELCADLTAVRARCRESRDPAAQYAVLRELGLQLGPTFRGLDRIWVGEREAFAEIVLDSSLRGEREQYLIHPTILDCGLQLSGVAQGPLHRLSVPVGFERITFYASPGERVWCHAVIRDQQGPLTTADVRFYDRAGALLLELTGYVKRAVAREALLQQPAGWWRWVWQQQWLPAADTPRHPTGVRSWLVLAPEREGRALVEALTQRGDRAILGLRGEPFTRRGENVYTLASAADARKLLADGVTDVVHAWSLEAPADFDARHWQDALRVVCGSALELAQAVLEQAENGRDPARITFVTRGAQAATPGDVAYPQTALWGFARVLRREHPELGGAIVDLEPGADAELASVLADRPVAELALRADKRLAPQLVRAQPVTTAAQPVLQADATYLISGGLSGLGLASARRLVERGARHLALLGRRARTEEAEPVLRALAAQGVIVRTLQVDVANEAEVARALAQVRTSMPPLRGVVHSAGVLVDRSLARQSWDSLRDVFGPKAAGAWNLHAHTKDDPLDFFVLYSSNSALVGLAGQANYAAANAFLDGLAQRRRALGLPALSINWGPWAELGLAARAGMAKDRLLVDEKNGFAVFDGLLAAGADFVQAIVPTTSAAQNGSAKKQDAPARTARGAGLRERVSQAPASERREVILAFVRESVGRAAGRTLENIPAEQPILDLGLDSLMTVELRNRLGSALGGTRLPATFVLKHPTVAAIADYLAQELQTEASDNAPRAETTTAPTPERSATSKPTTASNLVVLGPENGRTPLTLLHGIGGYAWAYLPLRAYVQDRPLVLVNQVPSRRELGEYVPLLVETLRTKQPRGPYILGGWSAGGRLALEVTAALERMGERVLGLVMFDVYRQNRLRRLLFSASRSLMNSELGRRAIVDMHPIERLLAVFGSGHDLRSAADVADLARLVLPNAQLPPATLAAGLAESARWFLDQLAADGGRGLQLPDSTGAATEALETLITVRDIYRMTMGEIQLSQKIKAPTQLINIAGNAYSSGWQPHFELPLQQFDVQLGGGNLPPRWGTPFSRFAEHIAMFDPAHVPQFGACLSSFLSQIDGAPADPRPRSTPSPRKPAQERASNGLYA